MDKKKNQENPKQPSKDCPYCGSDHWCKCGEYEREEKHNDDFYQRR